MAENERGLHLYTGTVFKSVSRPSINLFNSSLVNDGATYKGTVQDRGTVSENVGGSTFHELVHAKERNLNRMKDTLGINRSQSFDEKNVGLGKEVSPYANRGIPGELLAEVGTMVETTKMPIPTKVETAWKDFNDNSAKTLNEYNEKGYT